MQQKKIPMRMCVGCNEMKPKRELVRVVKNKEGAIFIDATGKSGGRRLPLPQRRLPGEGQKKPAAGARIFGADPG